MGKTIQVPLTQGKTALIDEADWPRVRRHKWYAASHNNGTIWYAVRSRPPCVAMHRFILDLSPLDKREVDHLNHNGLDNRRCNLKTGTRAENLSRRRDKSKYGTGVTKENRYRNSRNPFHGEVKRDGKRYYVGMHSTPEAAQAARQKRIKELDMAKISALLKNIGGFFTVDEVEAYGPAGITLTIKECLDKVDVGEKGESKPAIRFAEHAKLLIINKSRGEQLSELFGIETDPEGQKVKLVVENVKVGSRKMPMISIQAP